VLRPIHQTFHNQQYPDLLVGLDSPDDAAVWRLDEDRAMVITTDFFTPIVDTPYEYGAIAAANSLSDIYAMGAAPFLALNVAALPPQLPHEYLAEIISGAANKALEAGVVIAGGHTVQDKEPKFGLVAIGFVDPAKMFTKSGLKPGDHLYLSKPLGFGVTATALKQEKASAEDIDEVINWMMKLNRDATELGKRFNVRAATDVTGFSLLGHLDEMVRGSNVQAVLNFTDIPFLPKAEQFGSQGCFAGGAFNNKSHFEKNIQLAEHINEIQELLLFDPQTSGGLLIGVPAEQSQAFAATAEEENIPMWKIGEVQEGSGIIVK
jgi:selenide, water dikinase